MTPFSCAGGPAFASESFWAARWTFLSKSEGIKDLLDQRKQMPLHNNDCPCICLDGDDSIGFWNQPGLRNCQRFPWEQWESLYPKLNHYSLWIKQYGASNRHQLSTVVPQVLKQIDLVTVAINPSNLRATGSMACALETKVHCWLMNHLVKWF